MLNSKTVNRFDKACNKKYQTQIMQQETRVLIANDAPTILQLPTRRYFKKMDDR